jgi:hypothetical protein
MFGTYGFLQWVFFYVPYQLDKHESPCTLIWRRHHFRWRAANIWPMLGSQDLWAGRDLYRATPAVTWGLGFSGLIRRITPFTPHTTRKGMLRTYSNPDSRGAIKKSCVDWIVVNNTNTISSVRNKASGCCFFNS